MNQLCELVIGNVSTQPWDIYILLVQLYSLTFQMKKSLEMSSHFSHHILVSGMYIQELQIKALMMHSTNVMYRCWNLHSKDRCTLLPFMHTSNLRNKKFVI